MEKYDSMVVVLFLSCLPFCRESVLLLLKFTINQYLANHNAESKQPMPLVMFLDAIEHVSRVSRILRQPQGNALLLGVGGSGRQSMTKLATYIAGYNLFQVRYTQTHTRARANHAPAL